MAGRQIVVPLNPGSDGDPTHRPPQASAFTLVDPPTLYLERIGMQWMTDRGEATSYVKYVLERLPVGYALYERPRSNGTKDKYLYGSSKHKFFDSPNRFYPHFKHMMENNGDMIGCPCTVCNPRGGVLPGRTQVPTTSAHFSGHSSKTSSGPSSGKVSRETSRRPALSFPAGSVNGTAAPHKPKGRPKMVGAGKDATRVDEEGTPDAYRNLIDKLKKFGTLDEAIDEPLSLDWRAERDMYPDMFKKLQRDPQWLPRAGDIVLFVRDVPDGFEIRQNEETGQYQLCDRDPRDNDESHRKTPVWEAGVVGQPPADPPQGTRDGEEWYVSLSGVRVEPLPNPNDTNKALSKRYTYVRVEHTRPFFLWRDYVGDLTRQERHQTIENAFTVASTMSLVGKHRFAGRWPKAEIFCHAIYVGSEMVAVGDTVRLLPRFGDMSDESTDILVVTSIRLKLHNLNEASSNDYDEGRPYNSEAWVYGRAYTSVASRAYKERTDYEFEIPKAANGYGQLYPLHAPGRELAVPHARILGRLHEHDMMEAWSFEPDLDTGRESVIDARKFSSKNDKRIVNAIGTLWFWADSRADALDLHTINGINVSKHDDERDAKEYRKQIKIIDEGAGAAERITMPGDRNLRGFMAPAGITRAESSMSGSSANTGGKRRIIDVSDNEDVMSQTRIVTDVPYKKNRIQVIVD